MVQYKSCMKKITNILAVVAITAWVGGMWGIGYLAVPVLFRTLPDKMLAGLLAGKMFTLVAYVGMVSACYLLLQQLATCGSAALRLTAFRVAGVMLLLTLVGQFGLQPIMADLKAQAFPEDVMHSVYAGRFETLHHVASALYVVQSLLGIVLVLKAKIDSA
ncbi:MAG: DUF4149 domain-containing protein [Gallionellaceae bacterium]